MRRRKYPGGYSLLEMIVAAFIFAAVAVALSGVFSYHYRAIGTSRLFLVGQFLARDRMDSLINAGFFPGDNTRGAPAMAAGGIPPATVTFTIRDNIVNVVYTTTDATAPISIPPLNDQLNIIVTVSWEETNRTRNVVYSANIAPSID